MSLCDTNDYATKHRVKSSRHKYWHDTWKVLNSVQFTLFTGYIRHFVPLYSVRILGVFFSPPPLSGLPWGLQIINPLPIYVGLLPLKINIFRIKVSRKFLSLYEYTIYFFVIRSWYVCSSYFLPSFFYTGLYLSPTETNHSNTHWQGEEMGHVMLCL